MSIFHKFALLFACAALALASSTFHPARPPSIPLAVRSPYLSCWLQVGNDTNNNGPGNGGHLVGTWPKFWSGQPLGWTGLVSVDNQTYLWMGDPVPSPAQVEQISFEYTATRSTFLMNAGSAVQLNVSFLSPAFPTDMKRQSLTFSYLHVEVASLDGKEHEVKLYSDVSAEWISGDRTSIAAWEYGSSAPPSISQTKRYMRRSQLPNMQVNSTTDGVVYHKFYRQMQLSFSERSDQTENGDWFYATDSVKGLSHQSGQDVDVRNAFLQRGRLDDTEDTNFRAIQDRWPVFGFAVDIGPVASAPKGTLFSIGVAQDAAIQFDGANGQASLPSLWTSYWQSGEAAVNAFHQDFAIAAPMASNLDLQIQEDSYDAGGDNYAAITTLAYRQAFGATVMTNTPDTPYMFMKEISSDGNVQTVDVIFPAHPIFLYSSPTLLKYLLDPLFINQEAGYYPNKYSMHDLGSSYPNATGHPDGKDEEQPLEECGNMVIMTLAYAQRTNDTAYLKQHFDLLDQWTQYLIEEALIPANQISTDDFAGPLANQTNLALKGIIGIGAMATIASITGDNARAQNYSKIAHDFITDWQTFGIAHDANPPHTTLAYGQNNTHGVLYNIYGDRELDLKLVPQSVYDMQSDFYPTVNEKYGVPLDTRHDYVKCDELLLAAAVASKNTTDLLIHDVVTFINDTPADLALPDLYDGSTGDFTPITFDNRPVVGAFFSLLAVNRK